MSKKLEELEAIIASKALHHSSNEYKEVKRQIDELKAKESGEGDPWDEEAQSDVKVETDSEVEKPKEPTNKPKGKTPLSKVAKDAKEELTQISGVTYKGGVDHKETYVFKLNTDSKTYILSKQMTVWDPELEKIRVARYVKTEESVWLDEQSAESVMESSDINFDQGRLVVDGRNANLVKFLLIHDGNADKERINPTNSKFKGLYSLVRQDKAVQDSRALRQKQLKAQILVSEASVVELEDFLRSVFNFKKESIGAKNTDDVVVDKALELSLAHPDEFLDGFKNPKHKYRAQVQRGFEKGIIKSDKGVVTWAATEVVIHKYDAELRADDALARYILATQEGKEFYSQLSEKLN